MAAPFGGVQLPRTDAWAPITDTFIFLADLITWFLLISQFNIVRSRALLVLANGYLFAAVMNLPHLLTFPGAFTPGGLLGAGLQTSVWLATFWMSGYLLAVIFYALMRKEPEKFVLPGSTRTAIAASSAVVIAIALALTWIAIAGEPLLPKLFIDRSESTVGLRYVNALLLLPTALALLLLWFRGRSVLNLWLMVVMCGWLGQGIVQIHTPGRFSLAMYAARSLIVISLTVLLVVLLRETMTLYGRLSISIVALRQLTAEKLKRSEAYLSEAQRLSHTGSFGLSVLSGEIHWSEETYNIFEYDRAVRPTLDLILERIHPEDRDLARQTIRRATTEGTDVDIEQRLLMPDRRIKLLHILARALRTSSGGLEIVGAVTDVTAAKQAENTLRESEAYLAEAQRLSHTGSWAWNPATGENRYWSDECFRLMGFDPAGGMPPFETVAQRFHPDDQPIFAEKLERARRERAEFEVDYRIIHPGGEIRDIHAVGHPVLGPSGDLVEFVGSVIDVTERKQAEDLIRQSENDLRHILDFAPQQVAVLRPDHSRIYINQAALDYFGLTLEESLTRDRRSFFHPDDWERMMSEAQSKFERGLPHEAEFRLLGKDGTYRWFIFRYNPLRDEQGRITRWFIAGTDIENRKQAEQRLQNENVALREEIERASMFEEIVGTSPALRVVLSRVSKVAPTDSTVLITGETGTGKELIARAVHKRSQRSS